MAVNPDFNVGYMSVKHLFLHLVNNFSEGLVTTDANIPILLSEKVQIHVLDDTASDNFFSKFFSLRTRSKFSLPSTWEYFEITLNDDSMTFHNVCTSITKIN